MMIATGKDTEGRPGLVLGLSHRNLDLLRDNKPIHLDAAPYGVPATILIIAGETEQTLASQLRARFPDVQEGTQPTEPIQEATPPIQPVHANDVPIAGVIGHAPSQGYTKAVLAGLNAFIATNNAIAETCTAEQTFDVICSFLISLAASQTDPERFVEVLSASLAVMVTQIDNHETVAGHA